jgi:hypothetical protein
VNRLDKLAGFSSEAASNKRTMADVASEENETGIRQHEQDPGGCLKNGV